MHASSTLLSLAAVFLQTARAQTPEKLEFDVASASSGGQSSASIY